MTRYPFHIPLVPILNKFVFRLLQAYGIEQAVYVDIGGKKSRMPWGFGP